MNQILNHLIVTSNDGNRIQNDGLQLLDETSAKKEFQSFINANEGNHERYVAFTFKNDLLKATKYTVNPFTAM